MPENFRVIGFARREKNDDAWRQELRTALDQFSRQWLCAAWRRCRTLGFSGQGFAMKWRTRAEWKWFAPRASWRKTRYWLKEALFLKVSLACEEFRIGVANSQIG